MALSGLKGLYVKEVGERKFIFSDLTFSTSVKHGSLRLSGGISLTTPTQPYSYRSPSSDVLHSPNG